VIKTIILIGPPGSGKSSCGKVLAKRLDWSFIDTDRLIEDRVGMTVPEIFERQGERFFRSLEREFLNGLVAGTLGLKLADLVIGTGGGLPIAPGNFELLGKLGVVICLHASVKELVTRLSADTGRPLLAVPGSEPMAGDRAQALTVRLEMILQERWQYYQKAQYQFDTTGLTTEEVAAGIVKLLNISA
jgi:shikimate kinase